MSAPAAAIGGANGVVTFLQSDGTHRALWAARVVGGAIQATERIDAGTLASENVGGATVGVDDAGAITAVFSQYQGGRFRVLAARAVGGAWSAPTPVDAGAGSGNAEGAPQVATRSGVALAVWAQGTGTRARIYGARFDGAAWQPAAALDTGAGLGPGDSPQAGMTAADAGVVVWRQLEGAGSGRYRVYGARLTAGAWSAPALLDTPAAGALGDAATPALAVDATSGSAAAAWSQSAAGGRRRIYAARLVGDLWGAATALDAATGVGDSVSPSVALRTAGDGICAWYGYDLADSHYKVYASSLSGGTWSAPIVIGPATGIPLIGTTAAGDNLAVWYQNDGTRDRIVSAPEDHPADGRCRPGPGGAIEPRDDVRAGAGRRCALRRRSRHVGLRQRPHRRAHHAVRRRLRLYRRPPRAPYTVTLTAWDRAGNSASDTALVTVGDVDPPIVDAGADVAVATRHGRGAERHGHRRGLRHRPRVDPLGPRRRRHGDDTWRNARVRGRGVYTAVLTASDLAGNVGSDSVTIHVAVPAHGYRRDTGGTGSPGGTGGSGGGGGTGGTGGSGGAGGGDAGGGCERRRRRRRGVQGWPDGLTPQVAGAPVVSAGPDRTVVAGASLVLQGSATDTAPLASVDWTFGDGGTGARPVTRSTPTAGRAPTPPSSRRRTATGTSRATRQSSRSSRPGTTPSWTPAGR